MSELYYRIRHEWALRGYDGQTCWVQCRAGAIPPGQAGGNRLPIVVLTMQKLLLSGSDVFYELNELRTDDLGETWNGPLPHPDTLGRRREPGGFEAVICDATPAWHAASGKLLSTGHVARYLGDRLAPDPRPRQTAYTIYDPASRQWTSWDTLVMPDDEGHFYNAGAGCGQRYDLENGDILLPVYFHPRGVASFHSMTTVCRCRFDGRRLTYVEHGNEMACPDPRGFCEPSVTRFQGRFFLTLRNDVKGYVSVSEDGLTYAPPRPWTFDDGSELGNYNTQQHWVTGRDALYLVYTRRGLQNDHVFRHRAPLVMAQVDPERLCVLRETERVVVPERGARLGNFSVTQVSDSETWIVAGEWMQNGGENARVMLNKLGVRDPDRLPPNRAGQHYAAECECFGSDNTIWVARILWPT